MTDAAIMQSQGQSGARNKDLKTRILAYSGLFLLAYFVFLIASFPYDLLFRGLVRHFQGQIPAVMQPFTFEDVTPEFPLGAKFKGLAVGKTTAGTPMFEADSFELSAGLFNALFGKINANWKANLYGGKMIGSYNGTSKNGKSDLKLAGIQLDRFTALKNLIKMDWSGKLSGQMNINWSGMWPNNRGTFSFTIENASAKNVNLKVITTDFQFSRAEGEFSLENGVLTVKRCLLEGTPSGFDIEGKIMVSPQDTGASALDLTIIFSPTPEFEKNVPFQLLQKSGEGKYKSHLGGTFANPVFP